MTSSLVWVTTVGIMSVASVVTRVAPTTVVTEVVTEDTAIRVAVTVEVEVY